MTQNFVPPHEGITEEQLNNANVQQLLYLHGYLRNELKTILQFIDDLTDEQVERTPASYQRLIHSLIMSGSQYAQHLHAHHHGETQLMFPALQQAGLPPTVIEQLNREHDQLGEMIDSVSKALFRPTTADLSQIKTDLHQLGEALRSHLDYEETHLCPLLALWATPSEFYAALFRNSK